MGRVALALILLVSAVPAGAAASPRDDWAPHVLSDRVSEVPELRAEVLTAVNQLRWSKGLSRLRLSSALSATAVRHSLSMAEHGFFGHEGYDGSAFWQRIRPLYRPSPRGNWGVGENLLWASPDLSAQRAVEIWLRSSPHRRNLLSATWCEVGLGAVHALAAPGVYGGLDVTILTADFGVR